MGLSVGRTSETVRKRFREEVTEEQMCAAVGSDKQRNPEGPIISMQILGTVGFFGYQKRAINRNALEPADLNEDGP
jgi:hypothetical protein